MESSRTMRSLARGVVGAALALSAVPPVFAEPSVSLLERPDPAGVKTVVQVEAFVADVIAIRDAEQSFEADVYFVATWKDPRLAGPARRSIPLDEIWHPNAQILNDRDLRTLLPRSATVSPEGDVRLVQRVIGPMSTRMDLRDFPADRQTFPIRVVGLAHAPEELELRAASARTLGFDDFSVPGWQLELGEARPEELEVPGFGARRPLLTFELHGRRDLGFYRWTFFLPLALIVLMAWLTYWIDPSTLPPQIGIGTAAVFSLIAFRFSIRLSLPPVSYMTRVDAYLLGCTLLVFLALGQAVARARLAKLGREASSRTLDAWGRWLYVGVFAALTAYYV